MENFLHSRFSHIVFEGLKKFSKQGIHFGNHMDVAS